MIANNFNGAEQSGLICFNDIPNIVNVYDTSPSQGTKARCVICITSNPSPSEEEQYFLTLMGDSISNTLEYSNANNRRFYCGRTTIDTAASMTKALRNCPNLAANFNITNSDNYIYVVSKKPYYIRNAVVSTTNMSQFINNGSGVSFSNGQYPSSLTSANVMLNIYSGDDETYVTTLEKTVVGSEVKFNLSPIITSFAEHGKAERFCYDIAMTDAYGNYTLLLENYAATNYITQGYMVNQGRKYIDNDIQMVTIAENMSRGKAKSGLLNNTVLYLYDYTVPISWYWGTLTNATVTVTYLNSKFDTLYTRSYTVYSSGEILHDEEINLGSTSLDRDRFKAAFYIDVQIGSNNPIRYSIIKPLLMTEWNQRILWRNSYGGVSFCELSGKKELSKQLSMTTYKKGTLDYYENTINAIEKPYDIQIKDNYTFTSHIFEEDGKWIYNDLMQSSLVWTYINGEKYQVLIDSISVDEQDNTNNLYKASVKFHLSEPTTLI